MSDEYIQGYWDCKDCGFKRIPSNAHKCPNCGDVREGTSSEQIYFPDDAPLVTDPEQLKHARGGPDWICGACNLVNPNSATVCECGREKDEDDIVFGETTYTDEPGAPDTQATRREAWNKRMLDPDHHDRVLKGSPAQMPDLIMPASEMPREGSSNNPYGPASTSSPPDRPRKLQWTTGFDIPRKAIVAVIIALVVALVVGISAWAYDQFFATETVPVTVTSTHWERDVEIEELRTLTYDDWRDKLPYDAVEVGRVTKQRSTREEFDHTETRTSHETSRKSVGETTVQYTCGTKTVDKGNGYAKKEYKTCNDTSTKYDNVVVTKTYTTSIYTDVPVYDDWVTYRVNRWVTANYTTASGDTNPYWPQPIVSYNQKVGDDRRETYTVTVVDSQGRNSIVRISSFSDWSRLHVGSETTGEQNKQGTILSLN